VLNAQIGKPGNRKWKISSSKHNLIMAIIKLCQWNKNRKHLRKNKEAYFFYILKKYPHKIMIFLNVLLCWCNINILVTPPLMTYKTCGQLIYKYRFCNERPTAINKWHQTSEMCHNVVTSVLGSKCTSI